MKFRFGFLFLMFLLFLLFVFSIKAPVHPGTLIQKKMQQISEKGLFDSDSIFQITLKGNIRDLLNDRTEAPKYFPITLSYIQDDSSDISMPVEIKTRGHFRRMKDNCEYPPLLINFPKKGAHLNSVFKKQNKVKLVMPCVDDQYVVREWLAYKIYNLVTPFSFRARLVKVKLEDTRTSKNNAPFYGILLEEEKQVAKRNNAVVVDQKLYPEQIVMNMFFKMTVFQYFIGNTDWSIQYQQNIRLFKTDSSKEIIAVPYDFDHSGLVNAPYANPAEQLLMSSVRERRYRGYCVQDLKMYNEVFAEYNRLKKEIYSLITDCTFLDQKYIKSTLQWLDNFYKTINDPKAMQKDFAYPCDKNGTGNVVIKGLKED